MSEEIVGRLFGSFKVLEDAIINARENLSSRPHVKIEVLDRLDSYTTLLSKQRTVASELTTLIEQGLWQEVSQKIALINGLLEMIRTDARDVLASLNRSSSEEIESDSEEDSIIIC
jgi:hypothetical protein